MSAVPARGPAGGGLPAWPPGWADGDGRPSTAPEPPPAGSHYAAIGDFQGAAYARNAFAQGTAQEAGFLAEALQLRPGALLLDVGCGTGRHLRALAGCGVRGVGVDVSHGLLAAAGPPPRSTAAAAVLLVQADARALPFADGTFDAVQSVCQGGFGLTPGGDAAALAEMARVLRPGGRLVLTAFSLAFAVRHAAPEDRIDLRRGLHHHLADVRGPEGARQVFDLWTTAYSPSHLATLLTGVGLHLEELSGVEPGRFGRNIPTVAHPELLAVASKP